MNFFERMERRIDFQAEYEKIENIILNEREYANSIDKEISDHFREWKYKRNFASLYELREYLGFTYTDENRGNYFVKYNPTGQIDGIDPFLCYCEMVLNLFYHTRYNCGCATNSNLMAYVMDIIKYDLDQINHEIKILDDNRKIIVQKDAAVSAVADVVDVNLSDAIIEYNHYLLKGDLNAKKSILKKVADALEPRRNELEKANKNVSNDFFYLVNNFDVRHNNCDSSSSKYNEKFTSLSCGNKEEWYDEIYQEGLFAFLCLERVKRKQKIELFKKESKSI